MTTHERFIANTRRLMQEQNASQAGIGRAAGFGHSRMSQILLSKGVTLNTLDKIAKVFGVETWELIR